jgi:hypothetical protein
MVNIGGKEINLGINAGMIQGLVGSVLLGIGALIAVSIIGYFVYQWWSKKTNYTFKITLKQILDNGTSRTRSDIIGGKFINKSNVWDFRLKIPKVRKTKELGYMPDFSKADGDGRLYFITSGDGTLWQQYEEKFVVETYEYENKYGKKIQATRIKNLITPTPNDVKQATINSIRNWRDLIDKQKLTAFAIAIGAFIIMVIAHLISLYIQTKVKCPGV